MLVAINNVVGRHVLGPILGSLVIAVEAFFLRTLKHRHVQVGRVKVQHVNQILPGIVNGTLLKVVAKAPVAKHLKHGVVVRVMSNFLQVIVLTAHAQALLRVGAAAWLGVALAKDNIFPLVHTSVGKHQSGVVLNHHRSRRHNGVSLRLEKLLVRVADFVSCHHYYNAFLLFSFVCKVSANDM